MLMQNYSVISYRVFGNRIVLKSGFYAHSVEGKPAGKNIKKVGFLRKKRDNWESELLSSEAIVGKMPTQTLTNDTVLL